MPKARGAGRPPFAHCVWALAWLAALAILAGACSSEGFYRSGLYEEPPYDEAVEVRTEAVLVGGVCERWAAPPTPDLRAPVSVALDEAFGVAEVELVLEGFAAWGLEVASVERLPASARVPPGAFAIARCAALDDPDEGPLAGVRQGGAIGLAGPLVSPGVVPHELGHALGFGHSPDPADVMHSPIVAAGPSGAERARR